MSEKKEVGIRIRVQRELRKEFTETCQNLGFSASDVLRDFMLDFVKENRRQLDMFDDVDSPERSQRQGPVRSGKKEVPVSPDSHTTQLSRS